MTKTLSHFDEQEQDEKARSTLFLQYNKFVSFFYQNTNRKVKDSTIVTGPQGTPRHSLIEHTVVDVDESIGQGRLFQRTDDGSVEGRESVGVQPSPSRDHRVVHDDRERRALFRCPAVLRPFLSSPSLLFVFGSEQSTGGEVVEEQRQAGLLHRRSFQKGAEDSEVGLGRRRYPVKVEERVANAELPQS